MTTASAPAVSGGLFLRFFEDDLDFISAALGALERIGQSAQRTAGWLLQQLVRCGGGIAFGAKSAPFKQAALAEALGMSERNLRRRLADLRDAGLVDSEHRGPLGMQVRIPLLHRLVTRRSTPADPKLEEQLDQAVAQRRYERERKRGAPVADPEAYWSVVRRELAADREQLKETLARYRVRLERERKDGLKLELARQEEEARRRLTELVSQRWEALPDDEQTQRLERRLAEDVHFRGVRALGLRNSVVRRDVLAAELRAMREEVRRSAPPSA